MTYCVGMLAKSGMVMMADTRTNAGVDNISTYRKLSLIERDDRVIAIATAGNLSITQSTLSKLAEGVLNDEGETETLDTVATIFRAAQLVGRVLRDTRQDVVAGLEAEDHGFGATMLVGGRVGDERLRLFMIYDAGNAIECQSDTPFLQIGEFKYGKPILDRALRYDTPFNEVVKLGLISFDSTMRSNLAVGFPIDVVMMRDSPGEHPVAIRIERDDPYFKSLSKLWSEKLQDAHRAIPRPPFIKSQ